MTLAVHFLPIDSELNYNVRLLSSNEPTIRLAESNLQPSSVQMLVINNTTDANITFTDLRNSTNTTTMMRSMYHAAVGFIGGLFGENAPNMMMCTGNFTTVGNSTSQFVLHIKNAVNATRKMNSIDLNNATTYNQSIANWTNQQSIA